VSYYNLPIPIHFIHHTQIPPLKKVFDGRPLSIKLADVYCGESNI
jgi:hypothetical protein